MIELSAGADKLLEELKEKGVSLSLIGKKLRVEGKLSNDLKDRIRELKNALIQLVQDAGEWEISELRIPSQVKAGFIDVWSLGRRRCGVGFRFRFLRCERATDLMEGHYPMEEGNT